MEPIIAALIAGATAALGDTAKEAVKDAYHGLKSVVSKWFSGKPEAEAALARVEQHPEDRDAQLALATAIKHRADEEAPGAELHQRVEQMHRAIEEHGTAEQKQRYATIIRTLETEDIHFAGGSQVSDGLDAETFVDHAKAKSVTFGNPPAKKA